MHWTLNYPKGITRKHPFGSWEFFFLLLKFARHNSLCSYICRCYLPQSSKVSKVSFFTKILKVSVTSQKRKKKWQIYSPSASFLHTRRYLKKGKTGEETPQSVLMASSLRSIAPSIPVVSVALRRRFATFRNPHDLFPIRTSGFPNLSNPYFTAKCNKFRARLSESCLPL